MKVMKKEYMQPAMQEVKLQQSVILCGSTPKATSLSVNPEGIVMDSDGLDDSDDLR